MRYGITRDVPGLPSAASQGQMLRDAGAEALLEERRATPESQRRLGRLLARLKTGDEVMIHHLDIFQHPTRELARLLQSLLMRGLTLCIVDNPTQIVRLAPTTDTLTLLSLIAETEDRRQRGTSVIDDVPAEEPARTRLSRYQVVYARKLYRQGVSLRAIGLLFQASPSEIRRHVLNGAQAKD